jgi:predicted RNA methylase
VNGPSLKNTVIKEVFSFQVNKEDKVRQPCLWDGIEQKKSLSQWYTNPVVAQQVVDWALSHYSWVRTVLEPSAGEGALIRPLLRVNKQIRVLAYEVDPHNVEKLASLGGRVTVFAEDFLNAEVQSADLTIMNPPYELDQDVFFILRALEVTTRVIGLFRATIYHGVNRWNLLWREVDIVREIKFVERPSFGGNHSPMQDFVVLELEKRDKKRERGDSQPVASVEWL